MTHTYDVVIIGGGITGAAIAQRLGRFQVSVALLEKEAELAFGVSKSNSGIIHPGTQNPPQSLKGRLCVEGNRLVRQLARDLGIHFVEVGELIVAFSTQEREALEKIKADAESLGVPDLSIVGPDWLEKHEPNLSREVVGALYAPTAGIISPYRFVYDLAENAKANGVSIFVDHEVTGIERRTEGFLLATGRHTTFETKVVINAAGLHADHVAALAGIHDIIIHPRKGEEYLLDKKLEHMTNHLLFPLPSKTSKGVLVIKTSDGNPMVGPTALEIDDKTDLATTDEGKQKVFASVKKMVPMIDERAVIAYFAGLRPAAGSDFIIRHEQELPGFIQVAGIQSPGLTAAPAIARMVCGLIEEHCLPLQSKTVFQSHRQATKHLFSLELSEAEELIQSDPGYGDIVCRCEMVSAREIEDAISRGAKTMDGIKFRTRAQAGRCHGGFCTTRIMKILSQAQHIPLTAVTKRGPGSELVKECRCAADLKDEHTQTAPAPEPHDT